MPVLVHLLATLTFSWTASSDQLEFRERGCAYIYQLDGGGFSYEPTPEMSVYQIITTREEFDVSLPENTVMILCSRNTLVPHPADYKVINAGYDLMINSYDNGRSTLTYVDGGVELILNDGEMTEEERSWSDGILAQMQSQIRPRTSD